MKNNAAVFILIFCCFGPFICHAQVNDAWYMKGLMYNAAGESEKAIEAFTKAIEANPLHAKAYNNRGAVRYARKEWDMAAADYTRAIELMPDNASFYLNRGAVWFQKKDFQSALLDYNSAIRLSDKLAEAYNNRGMVHYFLNEFDQAIADHTRAIELAPEVSEYFNNRGAAWFRKNEYNLSIADYSRAVSLNATAYNALKNRGFSWFKKGLYDRAIADYTRAIQLDLTAADTYISRGIAYYQKKIYNKALYDFVDAFTLAPDNADAATQLAWILAVCPDDTYRNGSKSLMIAQKAVRLYPSLKTIDTLAAAYAETGDFKEAVARQEELISLSRTVLKTVPDEYLDKLASYRMNRPWRAETIHPPPGDRPFPVLKTIAVTTANIRRDPSAESSVIRQLENRPQLTLVGKNGEWYLAELDRDEFGWVHESLFIPPDSGRDDPSRQYIVPESRTGKKMMAVKVGLGRIRENPTISSGVKYRVVKGDQLEVIDTSEDWYKVALGKGKTGWAHKSLFEVSTP